MTDTSGSLTTGLRDFLTHFRTLTEHAQRSVDLGDGPRFSEALSETRPTTARSVVEEVRNHRFADWTSP